MHETDLTAKEGHILGLVFQPCENVAKLIERGIGR